MRIDIDQVTVEQSDLVETWRFIFKTFFYCKRVYHAEHVSTLSGPLHLHYSADEDEEDPIGSRSDVDLLINSAGEMGIFREM